MPGIDTAHGAGPDADALMKVGTQRVHLLWCHYGIIVTIMFLGPTFVVVPYLKQSSSSCFRVGDFCFHKKPSKVYDV